MYKKICSMLAVSVMATSLLSAAASAEQVPTKSVTSSPELVTIAKKKTSTKLEKIAYYQKKIKELQVQIDKIDVQLSRTKKSSAEYRKLLMKQNSLLEKQNYWSQKIIDLG